MRTSWGRRLAGISFVGALAISTACGPEPGNGGETPPVQVLSGSYTGEPGSTTTAGPICLDEGATVEVAVADNTMPVRIEPPAATEQTVRHVYSGGGSALFALDAGCHTFTLQVAWTMADPDYSGGSLTWTLTAPVEGLPISSPWTAQIGRQGAPFSATSTSEEICAPVGSGIEVAVDPAADDVLLAALMPSDGSLVLGDFLPVTSEHPRVLTLEEPCQQVMVQKTSFSTLGDEVLTYHLTWPVPAPPTSASATVSTTGTEPAGTVLWESDTHCVTDTNHTLVSVEGNTADIGAFALIDIEAGVRPPDAMSTATISAGGGERTLKADSPCYAVQILQQPAGVGVAQTFDVNLSWPAPVPTFPWTNEMAPTGGATDAVCANAPEVAQQVTISGASGPWTATRVYYGGGTDGTISGTGDGTARFPTSFMSRCARIVIEHTPVDPATAGPLTVTVS